MTIGLLTIGLIPFSFSAWIIAVSLTVFITFIIASVKIDSGFYLETLCSLKTNLPEVVLSFDDGPDRINTPEILKILKYHNVQGTFFVIGEKAKQHPEIITNIDAAGHLLGVHTYSHSWWIDLYSSKKIKEELLNTEEVICKIISKKIDLFRPPYGVTNPNIKNAVDFCNYKTIGWSLRSLDVTYGNAEKSLRRIKKKLHSGDVLLFHDTSPFIAALLSGVLEYLSEKNIKVVPLNSKLLVNPLSMK